MPRRYIPKLKRFRQCPAKYFYGQTRCVFDNVLQYRDFMEFLRESNKSFLREFVFNELLVLFLKYKLGWGRPKIMFRSGLSDWFFRTTIKKLRSMNYPF
jgi:hypothetical protein